MTDRRIWARAQALQELSNGAIHRRVESSAWQAPFPGVYVEGREPLAPATWARAAVLASGFGDAAPHAAVAAGRTAARVWGLPLIDDDDPATGAQDHLIHEVITLGPQRGLTMVAPDGQRRRELRRYRRRLVNREVVWHEGGFWITTPLRTAVDCVPAIGVEAAVCLLDQGLRLRRFSREDLDAAVLARRGRVGTPALAAAVALTDRRAESVAETLARLLLLPFLPGLVPQVTVRNEDHRVIARFDLADEALMLAIEVDGKEGHAGAQMVAKDRARDRRTERLGWWTERCTWLDLRRDTDELVARVLWRAERLRSSAA